MSDLREEKEIRGKKLADEESFTSHGDSVFKISFVVWIRILDYLLCENTLAFIDQGLVEETKTQKFPLNYSDRLKPLELALQNTVIQSGNHFSTCFFSINYQNDYEAACLLDAALNADLAIVERILSGSKDPKKMLRVEGCATITHLNIERTGTPLQMALYGHDEEMVGLIKRHMNPAEFQRYWEAVFGPDYDAFLERQLRDATLLCSELDSAFKVASATDVTNALNRVANAASALQDALNRFKGNLERYVREKKVHNPYILQRLFAIYDSPTCDNYDKDCLMSQQAIGVAQKRSSPRWLQHLSQGLYYLAQNNEPARRSFGLRDYRPVVDIRSFDRLGVGSCIHFLGRACDGRWSGGVRRSVRVLSKLMSSKNSKLSEPYTASARAVTVVGTLHSSVAR